MKNHNPWIENLFRPLVMGVMSGCVALSLVGLVRLIVPAWNGTYLIVGCVLATLEANYSHRLIRARSIRGSDLLRFRIVEFAMLFTLLKVGHYLAQGWAAQGWTDVLAEIQAWPRQPLSVLDPETMSAFVLALLSWHAATQTVRDLERLDQPIIRSMPLMIPPMQTLSERFFWGGAVLLIASGLVRIGVAALLKMKWPSVPGLVLNALVYFLLGLVMLGQVHFATLRRAWRAQEIRVGAELSSDWVRYSLALIGLAAFLAFLLPTSYTVGLLEMVGIALDLLISVFVFVFQLIFLLLSLPLYWLLSKLVSDEVLLPRVRLPPPQLPRQEPGVRAGVGPNWLEILRSLLFWIVALGMLYYVIRSYLHDHPELVQAWSRMGPIRALHSLWAALWQWFGGWVEAISERIPRTLPLSLSRRGSSRSPWRFFRLGALSPRERILYYYLSILRRAGKHGFPRRRGQTPYEYSATLESSLPQAQQEMYLLSQAFVEARYSPHAVDRDRAKRVRADWERVKEALRALKGSKGGNESTRQRSNEVTSQRGSHGRG